MEQYISKAAIVAEIEKRRDAALMRQHNLNAIGQETVLNEMVAFELNRIISFLDTLEVKDMSMPALDNGNMPVERWKEACEAASCQANYRKSKGLTETCDDYFVDGVQWADEHPKKAKEVDLDKEITDYLEEFIADPTKSYFRQAMLHFFELGLKSQKGE